MGLTESGIGPGQPVKAMVRSPQAGGNQRLLRPRSAELYVGCGSGPAVAAEMSLPPFRVDSEHSRKVPAASRTMRLLARQFSVRFVQLWFRHCRDRPDQFIASDG